MSSRHPSLTVDEQTAIDGPSAVRTSLIGVPLVTPFATGEIDMAGGITFPTGDFDVASTSADWADACIGFTVWIGSTALSKDKGVYFIRKALDSSHLYINAIGKPDAGSTTLESRESAIEHGDHVTIWENHNLHAGRSRIVYNYGDTVGTFYKFFDRPYTNQHTAPECYFQGDTHKAYRLPDGDTTVAAEVSITGVPHLASQSVVGYSWTAPAAMTSPSGLSTNTLSGNLPQGVHIAYCDVELSDSTITTAVRYILVYAKTGSLKPTEVLTDINDSRDRVGRRIQVEFREDLRSQLVSESMVMLVDEPIYDNGEVGTATVRFVGWLASETFSVEYGKKGSSAEIIGVAAVLGSLGADSQRLEQSASPVNFQQAPEELMTGTYMAWQLLNFGVMNWNAMFCYYPIDADTAQTVNPWDVPKGTYLSQIQNVALRMKYANAGFDSDGDLHIAAHPSLVDPALRSFTERGNLTPDIYTKVTATRNNRPENRLIVVGGFIYDGATMQAVRYWAPSQITGQASGEDTLQNIIVASEAELKLFVGLFYQKVNQTYTAFTFTIPGNYDITEPAHMQLIPFLIAAKDSPTGEEISGYGIPLKVQKKRGENGSTYIEITVEPLTSGTEGLPYPYPPKVERAFGRAGLRSFLSRAASNIGFGIQNTFSPATATNPSNQIKDMILVRNAGNTEWRVARIDSITPAFNATDVSPTSGQRSTLGPPIRLTRDPRTTNGYYLLCRDGIAYTSNAAGRTVKWIVHPTNSGSWTHTWDFTQNDGGWTLKTLAWGTNGAYTPSVGWTSTCNGDLDKYQQVYIEYDFGTTVSLKTLSAANIKSIGEGDLSPDLEGFFDDSLSVLETRTATETQSPFTKHGTYSLSKLVVGFLAGVDVGGSCPVDGSAIIPLVTVGGDGANPFTGTGGVNISDIAISNGGNVYWLSKGTIGGTDYVICNYTRNNFNTVASTQVAKYDANLTYNIQISQYNPAYIWVSAGTPGDDAAIYFSSNGAVSFTAGATLNTRGGSYRVPRSLPNGGQNRLSKNIVYVKGISTNLQGVRDGFSAATISTGSSDYPQTPHTLNSFPLDGNYVLVGLKSRDVYESHDGGKTWAFVAAAPGSGNLYSLEVWPSNRNYVLVAGDQCLAYSIDRGTTWTNLWSSFNTWATAQYGSGVATVILNALPILWTIYKKPVS